MTVLDKENKLVEKKTAKKQMLEFKTANLQTVTLSQYDKFKYKVPEIQKETQYHCTVFLETNFWGRIEQIIEATPGKPVLDITINTWTLKNEQTDAIIKSYDEKRLLDLRVLTGINFKSKRTERYARILTMLEDRGKRIRSFENHAKICIFKTQTHYITIESSANLWGHVAVEQFTVTEGKELYNFHNKWLTQMMNQ
jgi:hypothetical protein